MEKIKILRQKFLVKTGVLALILLFLAAGAAYTEDAGKEYFKKGMEYGRQRDYDAAISEFTEAAKLDPTSSMAYYNIGVMYDRKGDFDRAIVNFNKAIEIDPKYTDAYYNRGYDLYKKGDLDKALVDYNKVIEISPDSVDAYYGRGLIYSKKNKLDQALADYNKAIEIWPTFALAYSARATVYFSKKNYVKTLADVSKAQSLGFRPRPMKDPFADMVSGDATTASLMEESFVEEFPAGGNEGLIKTAVLWLSVFTAFCFFAFFILKELRAKRS